MSIFKSSFKPYLQRQLNARQDLVNLNTRDQRFMQYTTGKNSWCKMSSFVNYNGTDALSRQYILESGTLYQGNNGKYAMRSGVGNPGGSYKNIAQNGINPGLRPMPGIISIDIKSMSAYGSLREATIKFMAHSKKEVEDLEILFMRPGYEVLLEWGWSMYLDTYKNDSGSTSNSTSANIIPINSVQMKNFIEPTINVFDTSLNQYIIYDRLEAYRQKFSGNYDGMLGFIKNFNFTLLENGSYECSTIIISMGDILESLKINSTSLPGTSSTTDASAPNRLLTKFESIFLPLLTQKIDYFINTTLGRSIYNNLQKDPNPNSISNADFNLYSISYKNLDKSLHGSLRYISIAAFVAVMNVQFNLYNPNGQSNIPLLDIEIPYPGYGSYGNGLCLASEDTVSIDPTVCIVRNNHASFVTGTKNGYEFTKYNSVGGNTFRAFNYNDTTNLGIIGNIYVSIDHIIDKFRAEILNSDGYVDLKKFIEGILQDCSFALGSLNDFGIFVNDSSVVIIDTHYVEPSTEKINKYTMNITGTNSVIRNFNISSKIFSSQANMIAIAAQSRENIGGIQSSTYNFFNRGLTDRLTSQKLEYDAARSLSSKETINQQDIDYKKQLAYIVTNLRKYISSFLVDLDISQVNSNRQAANSNLNSVLLKIDTDSNYKAVMPISVEVTLDGLAGFTQGEIFRINPDVLPREYVNKNLGFIITGINNKIENSDWITTLSTQCCILDQEKIQAKDVSKMDIQQQIMSQYAAGAADKRQDNLNQIYIYNNLMKILVSIFAPNNPSAVSQVDNLLTNNNMFQPGGALIRPFTFTFTETRPYIRFTDATNINDESVVEFLRRSSSSGFTVIDTNYPGSTYAIPIIQNSNIVSPIFFDNLQPIGGLVLKNNLYTATAKQYLLNPLVRNDARRVGSDLINNLILQYPDYSKLNPDFQVRVKNVLSSMVSAFNNVASSTSLLSDNVTSSNGKFVISLIFDSNDQPIIAQNITIDTNIQSTDQF